MKIKKVDDKPMVIHTKQKAKIHTHEPKQAAKVGNKVGKKVGDKKPLNSRRQKIIAEMRDNSNITTSELHNILGVSETAVENNISFLRENGYIERVGSKKAGYWKVL